MGSIPRACAGDAPASAPSHRAHLPGVGNLRPPAQRVQHLGVARGVARCAGSHECPEWRCPTGTGTRWGAIGGARLAMTMGAGMCTFRATAARSAEARSNARSVSKPLKGRGPSPDASGDASRPEKPMRASAHVSRGRHRARNGEPELHGSRHGWRRPQLVRSARLCLSCETLARAHVTQTNDTATESERARAAIRAACVKCALTGAASGTLTTVAERVTAETGGLADAAGRSPPQNRLVATRSS